MAERGAFAVPTIAVIFAFLDEARAVRPRQAWRSFEKSPITACLAWDTQAGWRENGLWHGPVGRSTRTAKHRVTLRARVLPPLEILRSACVVNAEILNQAGRLGSICEGALADLLVVDGDPLTDVSVLAEPTNLRVIMKDGQFHKRTI